MTLTGKGVQVYQCQAAAPGQPATPGSAPQWVLDHPEALLLDRRGRPVGSHGAGPFWRYQDGSTVFGELVTKTPAPSAADIPWLLLRASSHTGEGAFGPVESIERTATHGGVAPASGCDAAHVGTLSRVDYTATYSFHAAAAAAAAAAPAAAPAPAKP